MLAELICTEIYELIEQKKFAELKEALSEWHPADLAEAIVHLPLEQQVLIFRVVPQHLAANLFEYLDFDAQKCLLRALGQEDAVRILNEMDDDDRTALLEEMPSAAASQLLKLLTPDERKVAQTLLGYPKDSVGRLMTPHFVAVQDDWTVKQVLDYIRENAQHIERLNAVYVLDAQGKLLDDLPIRKFLTRPLEARVSEFRDDNFESLQPADLQREAVRAFQKYDRSVLPVVDASGIMIGVVTVDDVLDVAEEEATEDIQKIGGTEALDEPYMSISLAKMLRKRAGWLVVLFLGELLTATAMGFFEDEIAKAVVLALFVPLIISSGGNSGSQAATLIIRAMALGEVTLRDWWRVMRREILAGLSLGGILGGIGFLRIAVWSQFSNIYGPHWLLIAITVGVSLVGVVMWGTLMGSMLPFLLRRLKFDPATSSAPFVATLVDVTGLVIYFVVAAIILRGTLL